MKKKILLSLLVIGTFISFGISQEDPEYATLSASPSPFGPYEGTGSFSSSCNMPNFTYLVDGAVATTDPNDTNIPGDPQVINNNGVFDGIFGPASFQPNIEVEVAGFGSGIDDDGSGLPISNTVTTTITFASATPPGEFGFIIADVEQDQVTICATYEDGSMVPNNVIDSWYQYSFNADTTVVPADPTPVAPDWDATNATLVGQFASSPNLQTNYVDNLPDNEAGAAAFIVSSSIKTLSFKSQALGVAPDDPSQHFIFASTCPCEGVAGVVFEDPGNDGCDDDAVGIANVPVELLLCNEDGSTTFVGKTTTGADGSYAFNSSGDGGGYCLDPLLTYQVKITTPSDYVNSTGPATACPSQEDDSPNNNGISECYDPSDNDDTDDEHIDFGIVPCQTMAGIVFEDPNNDGCDASGTGVPNVTVELIDCADPAAGAVASTTTANDGSYTFGPDEDGLAQICLLAGESYQVVISSLPPGFTNSTGDGASCPNQEDDSPNNDGSSICYDPSDTDGVDGATDENVDFGIVPCQTMAGIVFEDPNNDGCDASGTGVPNVTVELIDCADPAAGAVASTTTANDGSYTFGPDEDGLAQICLLPGGSYQVVISDLPPGSTNSTGDGASCPNQEDDSPNNDGESICYDPSNTDGVDGATDENVDFGIVPCEQVAGVVFFDLDNDGCDVGISTGVQNVTVQLIDCANPAGGAIATATTSSTGAYTFGPNEDGAAFACLLPGGSYQVVISNLPNGYINSTGNGVGCLTDNDDSPANYGVSACYDPSDTDGGDLAADEHIDFGITPPCEEMAGVVFVDVDENGCQAGEIGQSGVTVSLIDCNDPSGGSVATTTTGPNGEYAFGPNEDGGAKICLTSLTTYQVVISNLPADYQNSIGVAVGCPGDDDDSPLNDGKSTCYDPGGNDDDEHVDFGIVPPPVCEEMSGVVFLDNNEDGCQIGEAGLPGIKVDIIDCADIAGGAVGTMQTGPNGEYAFGPNEDGGANVCLSPTTTYQIVISGLPADYTNTGGAGIGCATNNDDSPNNDGVSICYDPSGSDDDVHVDFGIVPPPVCEEMAGVVFVDTNMDGCQAAEPGLGGINVAIVDCNDLASGAVATAVTGPNGEYAFGPNATGAANFCLSPLTTYQVLISNIPSGYTFTLGAGLNCSPNNDDSPNNDGSSICYDPSGADDDNHVDFGLVPPPVCEEMAGVVFLDNDEDGCQNAEVGQAGVSIVIIDCNDPAAGPVASTVTGSNGEYAFGPNETDEAEVCLSPTTTYQVIINGGLPAGYTYTTGAGVGCFGDNDDSPGNDGESICYDPSGFDDDAHVDFGLVPCVCDPTAEAGRVIEISTEGCIDSTMTSIVTITGVHDGNAVIPPGYVLEYLLLEGMNLDVIAINNTPVFNVTQAGWWTVQAIVYDPNGVDLSTYIGTGTGKDIRDLFALSEDPCVCGDQDLVGKEIGSYFCCMDLLNLPEGTSLFGTYEARVKIISDAEINMSPTMYSAGQEILLEPGFEVLRHKEFQAYIEGCQ